MFALGIRKFTISKNAEGWFNPQIRESWGCQWKNYDLGLISGTTIKQYGKKYNPRCQKTMGSKFNKGDDLGLTLSTIKLWFAKIWIINWKNNCQKDKKCECLKLKLKNNFAIFGHRYHDLRWRTGTLYLSTNPSRTYQGIQLNVYKSLKYTPIDLCML